jgi:hypothetical protein
MDDAQLHHICRRWPPFEATDIAAARRERDRVQKELREKAPEPTSTREILTFEHRRQELREAREREKDKALEQEQQQDREREQERDPRSR